MLFNIASNLLDRVEAEESWRPTIMVNAQLPWSPNPCLVDMVDYISTQNISIIPDPSFPKGASLRFAEFNRGIDDEGNIKKYLVKQASYGGTDLSITQSYVNEYNHHSEKRGYVEVERTINCLFYNFNTLYLLCLIYPFRNAAISAAPSYATSVSSYDHAIDVSKTNSMINIPGVPVKKRCG